VTAKPLSSSSKTPIAHVNGNTKIKSEKKQRGIGGKENTNQLLGTNHQ